MLYEDSALRVSNNDYLAYYDYENQHNLEAFRHLDEMINQEQYIDALYFLTTNITPENFTAEYPI